MVASIGTTLDGSNDNKVFGAVIVGTSGNDIQHGTPNPDTIIGKGGDYTQYGYGGQDYSSFNYPSDYPYGGLYGDEVDVYGSSNILTGGADTQYGGEENDALYGDAFKVYDSATVNGGADTQYGGEGNDHFMVT
jgi:serralysin